MKTNRELAKRFHDNEENLTIEGEQKLERFIGEVRREAYKYGWQNGRQDATTKWGGDIPIPAILQSPQLEPDKVKD